MGKWKDVKIVDVITDIRTGTTPSKSESIYYEKPIIDWYSPSDFDDDRKILLPSKNRLSELAIERGRAKKFSENTLMLVAIGATIGKVGLLKQSASSNQQITGLTFNNLIHPEFAYYWFKFIKQHIIEISSSATLPIINQRGIKRLPFKYPPLPEQKRIVSKLDALFGRIDQAIAMLEENLTHTHALMSSVLDEEFAVISESSEESYLGDVLTLKRGYDLPTRLRKRGKHPLYGANGIIDYHNEAKIRGPGVCTGRSGSIGLIHYSKSDFWPLNTSLYVQDFKGNHEKYIYYLLRSKSNDLKKQSAYAAVPTLDRKNAHKNIKAKIHSRSQQVNIAEKLDEFNVEQLKLEIEIKYKLENLKSLKSSLLDKAFKGEL